MRLTASRLELARHCLWWAREDVVVDAQEGSSAAAVGTALHAVAEAETEELDEQLVDTVFRGHVSQKPVVRDGLGERELGVLEQLVASWRAWWPKFSERLSGVETEQPFAISLSTGKARQLPSKGQRDYSAAASDEICGTTDVVAVETWRSEGNDVEGAAELVVVDYKTGRGPHRFLDHEDQMRFLGAAALLAEPAALRVRVVVAHVTPDGVLVDQEVMERFDAAVVLQELRELALGFVDAYARPGLHCEDSWCPAKHVCPATRALLLAAQVPLDQRRHLPIVGDIGSNDQAYATLIATDLLEAWIAERRKAVKAFADAHPVKAPDGRVYTSRLTRRETPRIDVAGAREALAGVLGEHVETAIKTKVSATWSSIKDAGRKAREGGSKVSLVDVEQHARAALREVGAVKVSEFSAYEWRAEERAHGPNGGGTT